MEAQHSGLPLVVAVVEVALLLQLLEVAQAGPLQQVAVVLNLQVEAAETGPLQQAVEVAEVRNLWRTLCMCGGKFLAIQHHCTDFPLIYTHLLYPLVDHLRRNKTRILFKLNRTFKFSYIQSLYWGFSPEVVHPASFLWPLIVYNTNKK